jgi:predicted dehydrogenase
MIINSLEETNSLPCNCIQIAYNSEWAIKRFFGAIREKEIQKRFNLTAVCGIDNNKEAAITSLVKGIIENGSSDEEKENARYLKEKLMSKEFQYYHVNGTFCLPNAIYGKGFQAEVIHSKNIAHLGYIIDAIMNHKHVLCEKPLVPVLNENGEPTDKYLRKLEEIVATNNELILMDAEHYSYKKASIIFYENLENILKDENNKTRKIKSIEGSLVEIDNPYKWRTLAVLSKKNQTGLLGDTMVHLLSFISNLRGKATPIYREYSQFESKDKKIKYDVDTYDHVKYAVENADKDFFAEEAKAYLTVAKFADKAGKKDKKEMKFVLDDNSEISLDLKAGTVIKAKDGKTEEYHEKGIASSNEYVNILNHFYNSLSTRQKPLTSFDNSLLTLRAIYDSYKLGEEVKFYN